MNQRRSFLKHAVAAGVGSWASLSRSASADDTLDAVPQNVNTNSKPSDLKITDLRVLVIGRAPMTCPIIRIDTNQGIYGLGEVRDGASKNYALMLKSRWHRFGYACVNFGTPVSLKAVCAAKGINLADVDCWWQFRLPQLGAAEDLAELGRGLKENGIEVVLLDPLSGNAVLNAIPVTVSAA